MPESPDFVRDVKPLLAQYCYGCHGEKKKGDLDLRIYRDEASVRRDLRVFEKVLRNLQSHEMPPENKPQPSAAERDRIALWAASFFSTCDCAHPDPGRVTLRRLNRAEYNNTIRDLVGVNFQPADDFPADDSGYGFDNIGDVLSLSPVLLEKYMGAAEKVLNAAVASPAAANGQVNSSAPERSGAYNRIFISQPTPETRLACARTIITNFATRAYRRPITSQEQERLVALFRSLDAPDQSFEESVKMVLEAVLVSPQFLFRGELQPAPGDSQTARPVDEYALASRLSYFLWSSMPDEELFSQAEHRTLRRNLDSQVKRMIQDPKAGALVSNFAGQWLQLRNLDLVCPDPARFPAFNDALRKSMRRETELFFSHILQENRSVFEFFGANYSFVDERLAQLYGIPGVKGDEFRLVNPKRPERGGLLTQASILTITSNPTRTSPVKRGKWVLENMLAAPPPPPPPNVPPLQEHKTALDGTLRQRMEQHRSDPNCMACHSRMDPIGFGLENYDAIGAWRGKDEGQPIDASGKLVSGEAFNGPAELKAILLKKKRDDFVRCLSEKMLTYALGRGLEYYDKCAVDKIRKNLARDGYRFRTLILEIARSAPFQMMRGEEPPPRLAGNS